MSDTTNINAAHDDGCGDHRDHGHHAGARDITRFIPLVHTQVGPIEIQRGVGALVGSACGDALGAPFEFGAAGGYRARFPKPLVGGTGEMCGGGALGWAPGEFTDDTQMALALAQSMLQSGGLDAHDTYLRWQHWARRAPDVGINTRLALSHDVHTGAAKAHQAGGGRSAANGALMRVTPIALGYLGDEGACLQAALNQARWTHFDEAAGWGAAVAALAVRRMILGWDFESALLDAIGMLPREQRLVFGPLLDESWDPWSDTTGWANGSVWICLAQAVWAIRHHHSFHDALCAVVDLGGDTDTVACVAGALGGARWSIEAIPSRWSTYVHGTVDGPDGALHYGAGELTVAARMLMGMAAPVPMPWDHEPVEPIEVMPGLYAADLSGAAGAPREWAVVSLSFTRGLFLNHPVRREVYVLDEEDTHNADARSALCDAIDSVEAFMAEGRTVVVHCHGGRSRTGAVLKGCVMRRTGLSEREAHAFVAERYSRLADWNSSFRRLVSEGL